MIYTMIYLRLLWHFITLEHDPRYSEMSIDGTKIVENAMDCKIMGVIIWCQTISWHNKLFLGMYCIPKRCDSELLLTRETNELYEVYFNLNISNKSNSYGHAFVQNTLFDVSLRRPCPFLTKETLEERTITASLHWTAYACSVNVSTKFIRK